MVGSFRQNQAQVWGQGLVLITDGPREFPVQASLRRQSCIGPSRGQAELGMAIAGSAPSHGSIPEAGGLYRQLKAATPLQVGG